jgi:hypothetical protein
MKKTVILFVLASILVPFSSALPAAKAVLIATQKSEFKDAVISKVKAALENSKYELKIIELKNISKENAEDYGVVILVNSCMGGRFEGKVKKFLKNLSDTDKKKVIVFTTAGGEDWTPKDAGVDCVTSASKIAKAEDIALVLISKAKSILVK